MPKIVKVHLHLISYSGKTKLFFLDTVEHVRVVGKVHCMFHDVEMLLDAKYNSFLRIYCCTDLAHRQDCIGLRQIVSATFELCVFVQVCVECALYCLNRSTVEWPLAELHVCMCVCVCTGIFVCVSAC